MLGDTFQIYAARFTKFFLVALIAQVAVSVLLWIAFELLLSGLYDNMREAGNFEIVDGQVDLGAALSSSRR